MQKWIRTISRCNSYYITLPLHWNVAQAPSIFEHLIILITTIITRSLWLQWLTRCSMQFQTCVHLLWSVDNNVWPFDLQSSLLCEIYIFTQSAVHVLWPLTFWPHTVLHMLHLLCATPSSSSGLLCSRFMAFLFSL